MSVTIGKYTFDGPYTSSDKLEDRSGVYAVIYQHNNEYYIVDVGESASVKSRVENHDRKDCWLRNCLGTLMYCVYYTPDLQQAGRMQVEQEIRNKYDPKCGKT